MGDFLSSSNYYFFIIILAIGAFVYYQWIYKRKKRGASTTGQEEQITSILAMVYDNITAKFHECVEIPIETAVKIVEKHETLGRLRDFDGKKVYSFIKYKEGEVELYRPLLIGNQKKMDPAELHYNLKQPAVELVMEEALKDDEKSFMDQWGVWLWWIAVMGFLGFMWSQA